MKENKFTEANSLGQYSETDRLIEQAKKKAANPEEVLKSLVGSLSELWGVEKLTPTELFRLKTYVAQAFENNKKLLSSSEISRSHNRVTPFLEALALWLNDYGIDLDNLPKFKIGKEQDALFIHLRKQLKLAREEMIKPYLD